MQYQYRFVYVFIVISISLMLAFFYDMQPIITEIQELNFQNSHLETKLARIKHNRQQTKLKPLTVKAYSQTDFMFDLLGLTERHDIVIKALDFLSDKLEQENMDVHIEVQGKFQQITDFIFALTHMPCPCVILDFRLQPFSREQYDLNIKLRALNKTNAVPAHFNEVKTMMHNPFCLGASLQAKRPGLSILKKIALSQIKMVGYVKQGQHLLGLLRLPNNTMITIRQGMQIGKERGIIKLITRDRLVIALPRNKPWILKM